MNRDHDWFSIAAGLLLVFANVELIRFSVVEYGFTMQTVQLIILSAIFLVFVFWGKRIHDFVSRMLFGDGVYDSTNDSKNTTGDSNR